MIQQQEPGTTTPRRPLLFGPMPNGLDARSRLHDYGTKRGYFVNHPEKFMDTLAMLQSAVDFRVGMSILEVGAGVGLYVTEMAALGAQCSAIDMVEDSCRLMRVCAQYWDIPLLPMQADACHLPFSSGQFDAVFSMSFFEHVYDREAALDEQIRVLKSGGRLVTVDGNLLNPFSFYDQLVRKPRQTGGQYGGLRWLFTRARSYDGYGGSGGWPGKDEDHRTVFWWRHWMSQHSQVRIIKVTTTRAFKRAGNPFYRFLDPFAGMCLVIAEKATPAENSATGNRS